VLVLVVYITVVTEASQREEMTFKARRRKFSFISDSSLLSICSEFSHFLLLTFISFSSLLPVPLNFSFSFLVVNECRAYNALEIHFLKLI